MFRLITQRLSQKEDEFDVFGKNVAIKLRTMTKEQKILAEKLINDIIFYGQMEQLSLDTQIELQSELISTNTITERLYNTNNAMTMNEPQYQHQFPRATNTRMSVPVCTMNTSNSLQDFVSNFSV